MSCVSHGGLLLDPPSSAPLLDQPARRLQPRLAGASSAGARLRRCVIKVLSRNRMAQLYAEGGPPSMDKARAYADFFLPKNSDGKLLPLNCSEAVFSAHVGNGVSIYMQFVKGTGTMFTLATLIAIPQYYVNLSGHGLQLEWPWDIAACGSHSGLRGLVERVVQTISFGFYSLLLGNASLDASDSLLHLLSELTLCIMFCVYVYLVYWRNHQGLEMIETASVRASDFAVQVSRLPRLGTTPKALKEHFSFFGPVASVALSLDQSELLRWLRQQHTLTAKWRYLLLELGRMHRFVDEDSTGGTGQVSEASLQVASNKLLVQLERHLLEMLRAREQLRKAACRRAMCTGHAVVVFRRKEDAEKCVRHFELIRRHEHSRDGSAASVDFRQLYFRNSSKLIVARAPEPSDILWENLQYSKLRARTQNVKTSLLIFLVSCVSTLFITTATFMTTMYSQGILTTLWSTPVIILSNVAIFVLVPKLAVSSECEHTRSSQHLHMLIKMAFFQLFNTVIATLSFLAVQWREPPSGLVACPLPEHSELATRGPCVSMRDFTIDPRCVKHWYTTGAAVLINVVIGDCIVILGIIDFIRPDKLIKRYLIAPRAPTQTEMNQAYALDSDTYLPFRYQLVLKVVCIAFIFSPAIPLLLPIAAVFMYASYWIDRYNLLRVFKPPPRTTDRTVSMSVLYVLPLAVFGHLLAAIFFYSKQAHQEVSSVYYLCLSLLAVFVTFRISGGLSAQSPRRIQPAPEALQVSPASNPPQPSCWTSRA